MKTSSAPNVTRRDIALRIASELGLRQPDAYAAVDIVFDSISRALASGGHCEFRDFGVFFLSTHKARIGRNPRKPERTVAIPTHNSVRFRAGLRLREAVARLRVPEQE